MEHPIIYKFTLKCVLILYFTQAATSGRILDHHNGTYSMYFVAAWSGKVNVNVTLVHPGESIHYLRHTYRYNSDQYYELLRPSLQYCTIENLETQPVVDFMAD